MTTVKEHRRKRRNKVSVVRRHNRKDKVSAYRGAKEFSDASREKLSQKGEALPTNKRDLANAISAYGRSKNPEIVKRWIIKRAKALGARDMLPENW